MATPPDILLSDMKIEKQSVLNRISDPIRTLCMSGVRSTESKNLRTKTDICSIIGAKILRLASLAQDDRFVRLYDKLKFEIE